MKNLILIIVFLIPSKLFSQNPDSIVMLVQGPIETAKGCPQFVLPYWLNQWTPGFEWPEFGFNTQYKECYNCSLEAGSSLVNVCEHYYPNPVECPTCLEITKLEMVYDPIFDDYKTIF